MLPAVAGASSTGAVGKMRRPTVAAMRLTLAEAMAGEAATLVAATVAAEEATDSLRRAGKISYLIHRKRDFLESFQGASQAVSNQFGID